MKYDYTKIRELFHISEPEPLPEEQITEINDYFGAIPKALEDYYRLCGGCKDMNSAQDFLLTPDGRYGHNLLKNWNCSEYCVFYTENQCACDWAVKKSDLNKENPPVYESYDEETWYKSADSVSQFLISHAYFHAAFSFEYSNEEFYEADKKQAEEIEKKFPSANADSELYKFFQPYPDTVIALIYNDDSFLVIYSSENEEHFNETDDIICEILDI